MNKPFILKTEDDLDLEKMSLSGQCFRWTKLGDRCYGIPHKNHYLIIHQMEEGRFELSCTEEEFAGVWHDYFDLETNYRDIRERVSGSEDPFLCSACTYGRGIRLLRQDPWEILISFIISQNRNIPAIKRSVETLCQKAGEPMESIGRMTNASDPGIVYGFPAPEAVASMSEDSISCCKLGYREKYVRAAADSVLKGEIDLGELASLCTEDCEKKLLELYGVGKKVASCIMLYGLHQLDAFPIDVWMKKILENEYPQGYPYERYSPYNGVYQQYMFDYYRR